MSTRFSFALLAAGFTFALPVSAQTTLVNDTFNRSGSLGGSTPTVEGGSAAGQTWTQSGTGTTTTNGSQATVDASPAGGQNDYLKVANSLTANTTYTITFNLPTFTPNGGDSWLDVGLDIGNAGQGNSLASLFIRGNKNGAWTYDNGGTLEYGTVTNTADLNPATGGTQATITLDTGTGTEKFYIGTLTATGTPDLTETSLSLSNTSPLYLDMNVFNGDTGTLDATNDAIFPVSEIGVTSVADSTPEPSTYALMLGGLVLLGALARRRRFLSA